MFSIGLSFLFLLNLLTWLVCFTAAASSRRRNVTELVTKFEWFVKDKEDTPRISVKDIEGGNIVMHTLTHLNKSQIVLKVPKKYMLSSARTRKTDRGAALTQLMTAIGMPSLHFDSLLVLYELMVDKLKPDSVLQPYYDTIPLDLPQFPCTWSDEDIALLLTDDIREGLAYQRLLLESFTTVLQATDPVTLGQYTEPEIKLLYNFVNSRNVLLSEEDVAINTGEFADHDASFPTIALSHQDVDFVYWTTTRDLFPGTEFTSNYGISNNMKAFLAYGFVIDDPMMDLAHVRLEDPDKPPLDFDLSLSETSRAQAMAQLRLRVAAASELWALEPPASSSEQETVEEDEAAGKRHMVAHAVEKKMLLRLAKVCKYHLNEFPTSMDDDSDLLKRHADGSGLLLPNHRNAILYRRGKKRVLRHYFVLATTALRLLTTRSRESFDRVFFECQRECHEMIAAYCTSIIRPLFFKSLRTPRTVNASQSCVGDNSN